MHPDSMKYTSFITPFGQYEFKVMPFGLKQAPGWFQLLMNDVLRPVLGKIAVVYLDDIIIFTKGSLQRHVQDVERVFQLLSEAVLQIKIEKCEFFKRKIKFLGHEISKEGIHTDPEKVSAMKNLPSPKNLRDIQSVMGLFQYYKAFVPEFARIAAPIYTAMKKGAFIWEEPQEQAFNTLKQKMITAPVLAHPDYDKEFILYTDASYDGLGFILAQIGEDGKEHPIQYGGRKLKPSERNYTITDLECLGIVWGVRKTRQFTGQNKFTLITDHKALETLRKQELPTIGRRTRWILELEQYNFEVKHRKGRKMAHVNHFSRQTDHLEAAVVARPLRVHFEDETVPERIVEWDNQWETQTTKEAIRVAEGNELWLATA